MVEYNERARPFRYESVYNKREKVHIGRLGGYILKKQKERPRWL